MEEMKKSKIELEKTPDLLKDFDPVDFLEWKLKAEKDLKGKPFEKLYTKTYDGIELKPIYTKEDIANLPQTDELPGYSNFIRGTKVDGYNGQPWEICQDIPYGEAIAFNNAVSKALEKGQTAISIKLDTATQLGIDSDYSEPEYVGDCGLSISGLNGMSRAIEAIDLKKYPLYISAGFSAVQMISIFGAFAKNNETDLQQIKGSIEADPIGYLLNFGQLPVKCDYVFDKMKIAVEWTKKNAPGLRTIGVSGLSYNNAGATAVQELAYAMTTAIEYIDQLLERGINIDSIAENIRFTFGIGASHFTEIAKFRAARVLWSNIIEAYGGNEESKKILIHGKTTSHNQTIYDPYVNMLRTTTEAFSAVIGGVDSLHTNPFDESFSVPDEFSRRIARNTQIILNEEANLGKLIDPAGGSYYIENLTHELANLAWNEIQNIENKGGMLNAVIEGYPQSEIEKIAEIKIKDIRKRKMVVVGSNMYSNPNEEKPIVDLPDQKSFFNKRSEYLQRYRLSGNAVKHQQIIERLEQLADKNNHEIIDTAIDAVDKGATIGELSFALRTGVGDSVSTKSLKEIKLSAEFDELKNKSFDIENRRGAKPEIILLNMGSVKEFKARADFSRGFFETGGFNVIYPNGFDSIDSASIFVKKNGGDAAVICSTDENYKELVPPLVKKIKEYNSKLKIILAGNPKDQAEFYKESGVDDFIYIGADAYSVISKLLSKIGE